MCKTIKLSSLLFTLATITTASATSDILSEDQTSQLTNLISQDTNFTNSTPPNSPQSGQILSPELDLELLEKSLQTETKK